MSKRCSSDSPDASSKRIKQESPGITSPAVASSVGGMQDTEDAVAHLLAAKLGEATGTLQLNHGLVDRVMSALLLMDLHLPENWEALQSISRTSVIETTIKIMNRTTSHQTFKNAATLLEQLLTDGNPGNIARCCKFGALPILVDGLHYRKGNCPEECANVLKLLQVKEKPDNAEDCLLNSNSLKTIAQAMTRKDLQEWGLSSLLHIMHGWEIGQTFSTPTTAPTVGQVFLESGAIGTIANSLRSISSSSKSYKGRKYKSNNNLNCPSPPVIRKASNCAAFLAEKSPGIRPALVQNDMVTLLGDAMKQWPQEKVNVQVPARNAIMLILTNAEEEERPSLPAEGTK